jgi:hypothetical protein
VNQDLCTGQIAFHVMNTAIYAVPAYSARAMTGGIIATAVHRTVIGTLVHVLRAIYAAITGIAHAYVIRCAVAVA